MDEYRLSFFDDEDDTMVNDDKKNLVYEMRAPLWNFLMNDIKNSNKALCTYKACKMWGSDDYDDGDDGKMLIMIASSSKTEENAENERMRTS